MATEEKIVYSVEVEGADKAADDFRRMMDELDRLYEVRAKGRAEGAPELFTYELAKSIEWLLPLMKKYSRELDGLDAKYLDVSWAIQKNIKDARKLAQTQTEVTTTTKKLGGGMDFAWGKAAKFFGAIGFGVYSMYSLASAFRRGLRAVTDFVRGGIEKAIAEDAELSQIIRTQLVGALDKLQLKLGQETTPGMKELASAAGHLIRVLGDTGVIEAFGSFLGNMFTVAARGIEVFANATDTLVRKAKEAKAALPDFGEAPATKFYQALPKGVRVGTGVAMSMIPGLQPFGAMTLGYEAGEYLKTPVTPEDIEWETGTARQPKPEKAGKAKEKADISFAKYRASRGRLGAFGKLRGIEAYREKSSAETWGGTPEELATKSAEIRKELTETQVKIQTDAARELAKNAQAKGAYAKMWGESIASAAQSGDVKGAFKRIAIEMGVQIALSMVAGGIASSIAGGGFGSWFKKFMGIPSAQETAKVPGGGDGSMLMNVHANELIIDEARVHALQAGLGIRGGSGKFAYEIPPAAPSVDVHVYPGADVDVRTALRTRAGERRLAQLEA